MKNNKKLLAGAVAGAAILLVASVLFSRPPSEQAANIPNQPAPVADQSTAVAQSAAPVFTGKNVVAGLGVVEPASGIVELSALMPGVISSVYKMEGDPVARGEIVAELVNDDLKALVGQAKSTVEIEAARFALVEKGPRQEDIARAEALLNEEQSNMRLFEIQVRRREALVRQGAIARETLDEARRALAASKQRRTAALQQLDILRNGSRLEEIEAARASYKLAEEKLAEAQAMLNKSFIRSTIDGVVLRRYLQAGEALSTQPAIAIMQIADTSRLIVRTQIDENDITGLKVGQKARISAPALADKALVGTITRISPRLGAKTVNAQAADEKRDTRVLEVIVALDAGVQLPVNLRVDVVIDLESGVQQPSELRGPIHGEAAATSG